MTPVPSTRSRKLGLDSLVSDNRFFDVLPRGVSKGPSLRRLIAHLDIPEDRVLAAGDTLKRPLDAGVRIEGPSPSGIPRAS